MKRLFLLLPLLALAAAPAHGADEPATNAVDAAGEFAPFTIKDAVARARAYEAKFSDPHVQPDITFYMISRCRDEKGEFWKFEYSPRRNNTWPDLELVVRPDGDIVESEGKRESGFNFVSESSLFRYCEAVGIDLAAVTAFEPEPNKPEPDWEDEPPEPPEPPDSIDLQDVDSFPDDVYGIICWTNAPIRVTDSLLFEVETNHFATLIAQADKIVVRSGGYVCCTTNVDNQPILATIMTLEEVMNNDVFPITRFTAKDGTFAIDTDFIPPCLLMSCDKRFEEYRNKYAEQLRQLGEHPNLKEGEGKQTMLRYMFRMQSQDLSGQGIEFLKLTQEVAQAVDYFIMRPNTGQTIDIPTPLQVDPGKWLKWLEDYMTGAVTLADGVELIDDSIDYAALLAQAKKELYEQLSPELYEKLLERIKTELNEELYNKLNTELTKYMEEVVKPELGRILSQELYEKLYEKLYTELFENLFNALYVTMPEEKEYIPQI